MIMIPSASTFKIKLKNFLGYSSYNKKGQDLIDRLKLMDPKRSDLKDITIQRGPTEWIIYSNGELLTAFPLSVIAEDTIKTYGLAQE